MSRRGSAMRAAAAAAGWLLAGCSVGPDYQAPEQSVPGAWSGKDAAGITDAPAPDGSWWKRFQDPLLDALIERAAASNQDHHIALARIREARAQAAISGSEYWPGVTASTSYQRSRISANRSERDRFFKIDDENLWHGGFDASWEIDIFGGVRRSVEAARAAVEAAQEDRRDVLISIFAEVARNYLELRGFQSELAIALDNIRAQRDTAALTRSRFQAGVVSELDVVRAEALVATTESQVPLLEASIRAAIHRLGVLAGEPPAALEAELIRPGPIPPAPDVVEVGLPADLLSRRPDLRRAERQLAAACARIGVAKADYFPRLFINGGFALESERIKSLVDRDSRTWSIGPSISWPIFAAGKISGNVEVQDARHEAALQEYRRAVLAALEDVENALSRFGREKERWRALDAAVRANRRAVQLSGELYSRGLIDFLSVLESQRALFQSEDQLSQSRLTVSTALVSLYKALGGGWKEKSG